MQIAFEAGTFLGIFPSEILSHSEIYTRKFSAHAVCYNVLENTLEFCRTPETCTCPFHRNSETWPNFVSRITEIYTFYFPGASEAWPCCYSGTTDTSPLNESKLQNNMFNIPFI